MTMNFQRRKSWTVGVNPGRRQVGDFHLSRRNTGIPDTVLQSFNTPSSGSPASPKSYSSLTDEESELRFKFPPNSRHRRATVASMSGKLGTKSPLGFSSGSLNKGMNAVTNGLGGGGVVPNGHVLRTRHLSTGSSNPSDDAEMSISDITAATNFFDFDENADDLYLAAPEEHVHNLRKEKKQGSLRKASITAQPFTPMNVETIGDAYIEEEGTAKGGHSRQGSKVSALSSIPESVKSGHSSFKSTPSNLALARVTPPNTPSNNRDILARDERIGQLENELEELKAARWKAPPINDTIDRILMGQSYCLEWYKSMEQKRALLDASIETFDGNCVTTVLLFIRKTMNHQILIMMLKTRPSAINHYCSFLKRLHAWKELTSVYQTLGDYESLGYLKLRECEDIKDPAQRLRQLESCQCMFKTTPTLAKNAPYIEEYIKLVKKQREIRDEDTKGSAIKKVPVLYTPVITTLLYCCRHHSKSPEKHVCNPEGLRAMFSISEKQYFQMCLLGHTLNRDWAAIESLITTKGFLGMGKKKKSPIGFERVVKTLGNPKLTNRPPMEIMKKYLNAVEDLESRLSLATYTEVYDVGIEALKQMRDRDRLCKYLNQIPPKRQGEFRGKICALVDNTQIKWRTR